MAPKLVNKDLAMSCIRVSKLLWVREITDEDVEDLAGSIESVGQLHQVIVRPIGKSGRMYELLAGMRRFMAQKKLGTKKIRCAVVRCDDKKAAEIALVENLKSKKPSSREWQAGAKRLKDLLKADLERSEQKQDARRQEIADAEARRTTGESFSGVTPDKSGTKRGRPRSTEAQATKDAAKKLGVSPTKMRRAIKREEDLIPSAIRALERKTITTEQGDRLSNMSAAEQQKQLPGMLKETQRETKARLDLEHEEEQKGSTATATKMLRHVLSEAKMLKAKIDDALTFMDGKDIDYARLLKALDLEHGEECQTALQDVLKFLQDD